MVKKKLRPTRAFPCSQDSGTSVSSSDLSSGLPSFAYQRMTVGLLDSDNEEITREEAVAHVIPFAG